MKFFLSYAHLDASAHDLGNRLKTHFSIAKGGPHTIWRDGLIPLGADWHETIQAALRECDKSLLFVSPEFLRSDYIRDYELKGLLASEKSVFPVALKPVDFQNHEMHGLEAKQFFYLRDVSRGAVKAYSDCTTERDKQRFADELFRQIMEQIR